jgi:predicted nucleic acid-binding protein
MKAYADTNIFTHFYLNPDGEEVQELIAGLVSPLPVFYLLEMEVINSFQQSVFSGYGESASRITEEFASANQAAFREDLADGSTFLRVTIPESKLAAQFESLSLRYTARHGFRTYDLLHVSAALCLKCDNFWSFDARASKLAKLAGLKVLKQRR